MNRDLAEHNRKSEAILKQVRNGFKGLTKEDKLKERLKEQKKEEKARKGNKFDGKHYVVITDEIFNAIRKYPCLQKNGPLSLLLYLLYHKTWKDKQDKHNTWSEWYKKKDFIVASLSKQKLADDLGVEVRTVSRWIQKLKEDGLIKVFKEGRENVYVVGEVVNNKDDYYYTR